MFINVLMSTINDLEKIIIHIVDVLNDLDCISMQKQTILNNHLLNEVNVYINKLQSVHRTIYNMIIFSKKDRLLWLKD